MLDVTKGFPAGTVPGCVNLDKPNALSDLHTAPFYHEGISPTCDNILIVGFMFSYDIHFVSSSSDNVSRHRRYPPVSTDKTGTDSRRRAVRFVSPEHSSP